MVCRRGLWQAGEMNRKTSPIRLLIADDHAIVRAGLRQFFASTDDVVVTSEASSGGQVLDCLRRQEYDVILLDFSMPGSRGTELIRQLKTDYADVPILVLSMHDETQIARRALRAGAAGYLTKDCAPDTLLAAIRKVAAGGRAIDPGLAERLAIEGSCPVQRHEKLSRREFDVLLLLAGGKAVGDIARELSISPKTVSTHKARLSEKMGFLGPTDLVRYAISHRLIE